jgi:uncharacterized protein (TIGR03437 family)
MRIFVTVAAVYLTTGFVASAQTTTWQLVWSDEFNGPAGSPADTTKWNYDLGNGALYGNEIETYTNSTQNVFQDGNGNLVIRAVRDSQGNYTSGRLQTGAGGASSGTANTNWQYGLIEARMKLPFGKGVWPAFWALGQGFGLLDWPDCGEIDIMENYGPYLNNSTINNGTIHGPGTATASRAGSASAYGEGASVALPVGETVFDDYHIYSIQWSQDSVTFYLDGAAYKTLTRASLAPGNIWVFNAPFFILLNVAIGGPTTFLGTPDSAQPFPNQDLLVDYVRVYQTANLPAHTPAILPGSVVNAASYLGAVAPGALAIVSGSNLADNVYAKTLDSNGNLMAAVGGVTVIVNGVAAPLDYVSPTQINFQVPWETVPGLAVNVQVIRSGAASAIETITLANASPSMFIDDPTSGTAWMTGPGCENSECSPRPGQVYQLWANGLGPKGAPQQDGVASIFSGLLAPLEVLGGVSSCQLTIGNIPALVTYCGGAPGLIIDQLNFVYPSGISSAVPYTEGTLTITGAIGRFRVPAPAQ